MIDAAPLAGLRNGQNTDLVKGTVRNADAVLLLLAANGGMARTGQLKAALKSWRPGPTYGYLFQFCSSYGGGGGYGFVGSRFGQASTTVFHYGGSDSYNSEGHHSERRNYYYRTRRGVVAISAEGFRRLAELGFTSEKSPTA